MNAIGREVPGCQNFKTNFLQQFWTEILQGQQQLASAQSLPPQQFAFWWTLHLVAACPWHWLGMTQAQSPHTTAAQAACPGEPHNSSTSLLLASHVTAVLLDAYLSHGGLAGRARLAMFGSGWLPVVGQVKGAIHFAWQGTSSCSSHMTFQRDIPLLWFTTHDLSTSGIPSS